MRPISLLSALVAFATLAISQTVTAQTAECQCNCYFSGDCPFGGQFCDWDSIPTEDNCWFRSPKPDGQPGQGCWGDHPAWGRCDGVCSPPQRNTMVVNETKENVVDGVRLWAHAMLETAINGGGVPDIQWMERSADIGFNDPETNDNMWRIVLEIIVFARGLEDVEFPERDMPTAYNVSMKPLDANSTEAHNVELAIHTVLAEMERVGAGRYYAEQMDPNAFDEKFIDGVCKHAPDDMTCIYWRLSDIADVLRQAGNGNGQSDGASRGGIINCKGCYADCVPNDAVDPNDLFGLLANWDTGNATFDLNSSGLIDVHDLFLMLAAWGPCVGQGPG